MKETINGFLKNLKIEESHKYRCEICKDTGYIIVEQIAYPCKCVKINKSLPEKLSNIYLENFNLDFYPKKAINPTKSKDTYYDKAKKLHSDVKLFIAQVADGNEYVKGLFITGPIGSGKTHLVSAIFNQLKNKNIDVEFFVVPDLLEQGKADMFNDNGSRDVFAKAKKAKVLILDDLGAHNYTPWIINQLYSLINYRLNNMLTTIITTNLKLEDIDIRLDERIASRILELCDIYNLDVDVDIRYKKNTGR
ncbi:MAG: ATP-binding protein [Firmicutes bacterium]|nr:ATP-binding protein [Bacillota bacterium]